MAASPKLKTAALLATFLCVGTAHAATLRWANQSEALSLDPHANNETMSLRFLANVYDPLVTRDQEGKFIPWLASEWQTVAPTRWRFTLRPGVHFENGDVLTAADVVFSLKRAGAPLLRASRRRPAGIVDVTADRRPYRRDRHDTRSTRPTLLNEISSIDIMDEAWAGRT